jgi:hypothetical protein
MTVKAADLSRASARSQDINCVLREQLRLIDDRLTRSVKIWGRNVVRYEVPTTFGIIGLDKKNMQLIIYTEILQSLVNRGFEVRIFFEEQRTEIFIAWTIKISAEEAEAMKATIRSKRIEKDKIDDFIRNGPPNAKPRSQEPSKVSDEAEIMKL